MSVWPRAIALMDMNAFFCGVEQRDNPLLEGRPIGVTNGVVGSCVITCSYEARRYGVKTGMRVREAKVLCPDFTQIPARPERYAEVSSNIMDALLSVTPDVEIFSVDEAFLDVTRCQRLHGSPLVIGRLIKQTVFEASGGLLSSVGISGDKTTAKYAAKLQKPNGLTLIPPWQAKAALAGVRVTELCGINKGVDRFLAARGVILCRDMQKLPISELGRRFGNIGRRIWLMTQGQDPAEIEQNVPPPQSIGHGKIMPPNTQDAQVIKTYLHHMAAKVGARLRRHTLQAKTFFIGLKTAEGWIGGKYRSRHPTDDDLIILELCHRMQACWQGEGVYQVQITALDPKPYNQQLELFSEQNDKRAKLYNAIDDINQRFGEFAVASAQLLNRSSMPNVIAPAWKPYGHRETILKR